MKFFFLPLFIFTLVGCESNETITPLMNDGLLGNWRVIEETDKVNNKTSFQESGIVTTWNGLTYINALQINSDNSLKLNYFGGDYTPGHLGGTWRMNTDSSITFNIHSFSKSFKVWKKDGSLFLESSTHIIRHVPI